MVSWRATSMVSPNTSNIVVRFLCACKPNKISLQTDLSIINLDGTRRTDRRNDCSEDWIDCLANGIYDELKNGFAAVAGDVFCFSRFSQHSNLSCFHTDLKLFSRILCCMKCRAINSRADFRCFIRSLVCVCARAQPWHILNAQFWVLRAYASYHGRRYVRGAGDWSSCRIVASSECCVECTTFNHAEEN